MAMSKDRLVAALSGGHIMCDALVDDQQRQQPSGDGETFHLSVQFALAHGFRPAVPRGEITTLRSSTLLSGAYSQ